MYTEHGHHIPGTDRDSRVPATVARCGGPGMCHACSRECLRGWARETQTVLDAPIPDMAPSDKARIIVAQYLNRLIEEGTDSVQLLTLKDIFVVWFSKTLQNWKCIVCTNMPDGMIFEVTYNGDKHETYLDAYKKFQNLAIPDEPVR